jgi:Sec-independent protein translocase protein TatA
VELVEGADKVGEGGRQGGAGTTDNRQNTEQQHSEQTLQQQASKQASTQPLAPPHHAKHSHLANSEHRHGRDLTSRLEIAVGTYRDI